MKINPLASTNAISAYKLNKPSAPQKPYGSQEDQVSFSEEVKTFSSTINKLKEKMETRTPEEMAHIREVAAQIKNGSYHVDSETVAAKMMKDYMGFN